MTITCSNSWRCPWRERPPRSLSSTVSSQQQSPPELQQEQALMCACLTLLGKAEKPEIWLHFLSKITFGSSLRSKMVKAIFSSASLLPFRQHWHSPPVLFLLMPSLNSACWCFKSVVIYLLWPMSVSPRSPSLPLPQDSPSGGGQWGKGGTHPLHTYLKPPIPPGLLHRVPALLHTSEMELSLPAPAWTWLPPCQSFSEFPRGFQPAAFPGA